MKNIFRLLWPFFALCGTIPIQAQQTVNALFIGNSYTEVNNLPGMVQQIAASMGDLLTWQSNTPGGCTFNQHCSNHSMELICGGGWDIVVLQEQSQYPSFPQSQVEAEVFPYAKRLVDSVYAHNPCGEPMFYMTWGRKNGDAGNAPYFPVLGTYEGMDSMLCERYTYMAQQNDASLCPVGRVWRYLRENLCGSLRLLCHVLPSRPRLHRLRCLAAGGHSANHPFGSAPCCLRESDRMAASEATGFL